MKKHTIEKLAVFADRHPWLSTPVIAVLMAFSDKHPLRSFFVMTRIGAFLTNDRTYAKLFPDRFRVTPGFRFLSFLLAFFITASQITTGVAFAESNPVKDSDGAYLNVSSKESDFEIDENGVLTKYLGEGGDVVIPDGVTSIGGSAFNNCDSLTSIIIPDSVISIGYAAFWNCYKLTSVNIPDSVTSIGSYAFAHCSHLPSVTIPNSITSIGDEAFMSCRSLTSITIPDSVGSISDKVFWGCDSLTSVNIPDSITSIGNEAFNGCNNLPSVTIPNSITSIGDSAFEGCRSLTSITIPDSVGSIGDGVFWDCSSLTSIKVESTNQYYMDLDGNLFTKDAKNLSQYAAGKNDKSYSIPDSVTNIGTSAFGSCDSLISVSIPNSVTSIDDRAFEGCKSLTSIPIPNSVTNIGDSAFKFCDSLTSVAIPDSATSIGNEAFNGCNNLTSVTIPDSVTSIGSYAFASCVSLTSIPIPNSVTSIGSCAFKDCSSLTSVTIPDSVTSIGDHDGLGDYTFANCTSLTSVTISNSLTSTGSYTFSGCSRLTSVIIPNSVTNIEYGAFRGCDSLTSITIPSSITTIASNAFDGCTNLTIYGDKGSYAEVYANEHSIPFLPIGDFPDPDKDFEIKDGVLIKYNGHDAFVTIPEGVTEIGENVFLSSDVFMVNFPKSLKKIGKSAFSNCQKLEYASLNNTQVTEIADNAFAICPKLVTLTPSPVLEVIGENAFANCDALQSMTFAKGLKTIRNGAFMGCGGLEKLTIPGDPDVLGVPFFGCKSLTLYGQPNSYLAAHAKENNIPFKPIGEDGESMDIDSSMFSFGANGKDKLVGPEIKMKGEKFPLFSFDLSIENETLARLLKVTTSYDDATKLLKVKVGKSTPKFKDDDKVNPGDPYWEEDYYNLKQMINTFGGKTNTEFYNKFRDLRKTLKSQNLRLGFDFDAQAFGYMQFNMASGTPHYDEGGVGFLLSLDASLTTGWPPASNLVYVKCGVEAEAGGGFKLVVKEIDKVNVININGNLSLSITPFVQVGADISVAELHARLDATLAAALNIPAESLGKSLSATLTGSFTLGGSLLGYSTDLYKADFGTIQLYPSQSKKSRMAPIAEIGADDFKLMDRSYLNRSSNFTANAQAKSRSALKKGVEQSIQTNVYPYAHPKLVPLADQSQLLVWEGDIAERSDANRTSLLYSIYNGATWSAPKQIIDDATADFSPQVLADEKGNAYVVWQNASKVFSNDVSMEQMAENMDLSFVKFDGASKSFGTPSNICSKDNKNYEYSPQLAVDGENLTVTWLETVGENPYTSTQTILKCRQFSNNHWMPEEVIRSTSDKVTSVSTAYENSQSITAYITKKSDNNEESEIWMYKNGQDKKLTNTAALRDKVFLLHEAGTLELFYLENNQLLSVDFSSGSIGNPTGFVLPNNTENVQLIENGNLKAATWEQSNGFTSTIWGAYFNPKDGSWSGATQMSFENEKLVQYSSSYLDDIGNVHIGYGQTNISNGAENIYGQNNLCVLDVAKFCNLAIDGNAYYDTLSLKPGELTSFCAEVLNLGGKDVTGVKIQLLDESKNVLTEGEYNGIIPAGKSQTVGIAYKISEELLKGNVTVKIDPLSEKDIDSSDNASVIPLGLTDIAIRSTAIDSQSDNLDITVENIGYSDATEVCVEVRDDNQNGKVLQVLKSGTLSVGQSQVLSLDSSKYQEGQYLFLHSKTDNDENSYANNDSSILLGKSALPQMISLNENRVTCFPGDMTQLSATVAPLNTQLRDVQWSAADPDIADVDAHGKVTALNEGITQIRATSLAGDVSAVCVVEVKSRQQAVDITGISLDKSVVSLKIGSSTALHAFLQPINVDNADLIWKSENPSVANVNENGEVTAVSTGKAIISVTASEGISASCVVTVTDEANPEDKPISVTQLRLSKTALSLHINSTERLDAVIEPNNATNKTVVWKSSNQNIAMVDATGTIAALSIGTVIITATASNGISASCTVQVTDGGVIPPDTVEVKTVALNKQSLSMYARDNQLLKASISPSNATNQTLLWESSNTKVCTVSKTGSLTAYSTGTAEIKVTASNGVSATCIVVVSSKPSHSGSDKGNSDNVDAEGIPDNSITSPIPATSFNLDTASYSFSVGQRYCYLVKTPIQTVPLSLSSNPSVVSVEYGKKVDEGFIFAINGMKEGTAEISVQIGNEIASFPVTVKPGTVHSDTTEPISVKTGESYTFLFTVDEKKKSLIPQFTTGNGTVLKTHLIVKNGCKYYLRVYAVGKVGDKTGIYSKLPGENPVLQSIVTIN